MTTNKEFRKGDIVVIKTWDELPASERYGRDRGYYTTYGGKRATIQTSVPYQSIEIRYHDTGEVHRLNSVTMRKIPKDIGEFDY